MKPVFCRFKPWHKFIKFGHRCRRRYFKLWIGLNSLSFKYQRRSSSGQPPLKRYRSEKKLSLWVYGKYSKFLNNQINKEISETTLRIQGVSLVTFMVYNFSNIQICHWKSMWKAEPKFNPHSTVILSSQVLKQKWEFLPITSWKPKLTTSLLYVYI